MYIDMEQEAMQLKGFVIAKMSVIKARFEAVRVTTCIVTDFDSLCLSIM